MAADKIYLKSVAQKWITMSQSGTPLDVIVDFVNDHIDYHLVKIGATDPASRTVLVALRDAPKTTFIQLRTSLQTVINTL